MGPTLPYVLLLLSGFFSYSTAEDEVEGGDDTGSFLVYNKALNVCINVESATSVTVAMCDFHAENQKFRWVSESCILSLSLNLCMGAQEIKDRAKVQFFHCNENNKQQHWQCKDDKNLFGIKDQDLHLNWGNNRERNVIIYHGTGDWSRWRIFGSQGDLCSKGFQDKPNPTLISDRKSVLTSNNVTLTCTVKDGRASWKIYWFRLEDNKQLAVTDHSTYTFSPSIVSESGGYWCRGERGDPPNYTQNSNTVSISVSEAPVPVLSRQPDWPELFTGETVTLQCTIQEGSASDWKYTWWKDNNPVKMSSDEPEYSLNPSVTSSGEYHCRGQRKRDRQYSKISNAITVSFKDKPKTTLTSDRQSVLTSNSVTLTCTVEDGTASWKFYWYKNVWSKPVKETDQSTYTFIPSSVSESGNYWCRGGRGDPPYYTHHSTSVHITVSGDAIPVLSKQPDWPVVFIGETVILKCTIQEGSASDWTYWWKDKYNYFKSSSVEPEYSLSSSRYPSGEYQCRGQRKQDHQYSKLSNIITVSFKVKPQAVLSLSPPWLSPGASVILSCEVKESSSDWRFYWYRAVPKPSDNSYTYELLPGNHTGTVKASYIIGPTGTGGYVCKAGRGDPAYYTRNSEPQFVWSGDVHSSASLTVSSNRTQHFSSESVSLNCEGNSTEWKVKKYSDRLNGFSPTPSMIGSTWTRTVYTSGVYWCESGLGEYSNAVNITVHYGDVILVSPVHPVTEGHSVTLQCKHRTVSSLSNVDFYRNEELVRNNTNGEMIIPAVSKSDEGFYKCEYSGGESTQSWMVVRLSQHAVTVPGPVGQSSPLVVGLIVGLVVAILLIVILLLLCRYRTSKGPCCVRSVESQITNQNSASDQQTNQRGPPGDSLSPLQHDEPAAEPSDVTYSQIELKPMGKKKKVKPADPLESSLYSEVKTGSATGTGEPDVTYAQVNHQGKRKAKNKKAPDTEDAVYSQVKPGTSLGW